MWHVAWIFKIWGDIVKIYQQFRKKHDVRLKQVRVNDKKRVKFEEVLNWIALGINEQLLFTKKEFFKRLQCGAGGKSARFLAGVPYAEYSVLYLRESEHSLKKSKFCH